jgi:hypothetical protein
MPITFNWPLVTVSVLAVGVVSAIIIVFLFQKSNSNANLNNVLIPFSATIQPGDNTVFLKNSAGNPQIDCSNVGGKINIVGAWTETIDPYGTCTGTSADVLNLSCGIKGAKVPCKQDADCGAGMSCAGGICVPSICNLDNPGGNNGKFTSSNCACGGTYCPIQPGTVCDPNNANSCNDPTGSIVQCLPLGSSSSYTCQVNAGQNCMAPDPYTGQFCASYPLCSNVDKSNTKSVVNTVCNPSSPANCRPRDSSAYLAAKCDGKSACALLFDPNDPLSGFGPKPCDTRNTSQLPITPGQSGNYSQGYYVHGLYTCIVPQ